MIDKRTLAAIGGFAFVAAWIGFSFGEALLCLLGAAVFWLVAGVLEGKIDLAALQGRLQGKDDAAAPGAASRPAPPPPPAPAPQMARPVRRPGRPRVR